MSAFRACSGKGGVSCETETGACPVVLRGLRPFYIVSYMTWVMMEVGRVD